MTPAKRLADSPLLPAVAAALLGVLGGCGSDTLLVKTPHVMVGPTGVAVFEEVPERLRTPHIPIVFFTDRLDENADEPGLQPSYGSQRSSSITFGVATVSLDPEPTWDQLVADSTSLDRDQSYKLSVSDVRVAGEIPSIESRLRVSGDRVVYPPEASADFAQDLANFHACLEPWLDPAGDNAALVFVHGFNNTFDSSVLRLAQTWHLSGRHGVPIVYSWPAGYDTWIKPIAYNHDRESGEFAVLQLKTLLIALSADDRIDRIHLIAHSRGTDVASTALREICQEVNAAYGQTYFAQEALGAEHMEAMGDLAPPTPAEVLKIKTLLLVAPDLDIDVFTHRFLAERVMHAAERVVVYTSRKDGALGLAKIFFASSTRLGDSTMDDFTPEARSLINALPTLEIVECEVGGVSSHAYLFQHPAARSDMIMVVREHEIAGQGRPLEPLAPGFWLLDDDYLRDVAETAEARP